MAFDGPIAEGAGREEVDVGGLAVAPGFIDLHTHSDVSLLSEPGCISAIEQGVTTQAVGLCGFSAGPVGPESLARLVEEEPVFAFPGVTWDWTTIGGYREAVERARPATNVTTFVGHNSLRRFVVGSANRPPTDAELARMVDLIGEAIDQGARGFTTGLSYAPGLFASVDELTALAGAAAARGRPYHTHMRYGPDGVVASVREALLTAERSGVELNISHMYPHADLAPEAADELLGLLDDARGRGLDVTFDLTVFQRGGGAWVQSLPAWARDGGQAGTEAVIRDPESRARLVAYLEGPDVDWWMADWDDQLICKVNRPELADLAGRVDRRDRARAGPGADGHRARPRPRGRPVLDRPDDQEPGPPRSADRQPAVRADRRRVRPPSGAPPGLRDHAQELRDVPAGARVVRPRPGRAVSPRSDPQDHGRACPTSRPDRSRAAGDGFRGGPRRLRPGDHRQPCRRREIRRRVRPASTGSWSTATGPSFGGAATGKRTGAML